MQQRSGLLLLFRPSAVTIITPAVVVGVATIPSATVSTGSTISPAVVVGVATIPTPTVSVPTDVTLTPAVVVAVAFIPTPVVTTTADATITPAVVVGIAFIPVPTVIAGVPPETPFQPVEYGIFYRHSDATRKVLLLLPNIMRSGATAVRETATFDQVSPMFRYKGGTETLIMGFMAAAWAAEQNSSTAVLRAAIRSALENNGYRDPIGAPLV